ncbi:unnamed protein product, partial [Anisakis simplex]|uniref:POU-specific domain-containing protein n=1 Tax=Anisakis simplex TaxID=6269 RepID=A0A0M3JCK8_ANISI
MDNATQATQAHGLTAADVFGAAAAAASNLHMGLSAGTMMLPTVAFTSSGAQSQLSQSGNALSSAVSATPSIPYFSWPPQQPIINIPFFDANLYKTVNLDAQPSCLPNGMDLPLNDITTLRCHAHLHLTLKCFESIFQL